MHRPRGAAMPSRSHRRSGSATRRWRVATAGLACPRRHDCRPRKPLTWPAPSSARVTCPRSCETRSRR
jgi:hypothetical protein